MTTIDRARDQALKKINDSSVLQWPTPSISGQWRTEEGVRGQTPIGVTECIKIWYFQQHIPKKMFWGGAQPPVGDSPSGEGPQHPTPLGACGISTPSILKSWVRHCIWQAVIIMVPRNKSDKTNFA